MKSLPASRNICQHWKYQWKNGLPIRAVAGGRSADSLPGPASWRNDTLHGYQGGHWPDSRDFSSFIPEKIMGCIPQM